MNDLFQVSLIGPLSCYTLLSNGSEGSLSLKIDERERSEGVQSCSSCYLCMIKIAYNICSKLPFEDICLSL